MIRIIKFEVASDGISPATLQDAGIQGEDRATELKFTLSDELYSSLVEGGGTLFYRFDIETSTGLTLSLTSNNLEGKDISLPLVRVLTRDGGTARVTLIITSVSEDFTTESDVYSHACHIRFDNKRDSTTEEEYESLTTIEQSAKASAGRAETAAAETAKAAAETKAAQRRLENGDFILDGNGINLNSPIVIDDSMEGSDGNPVTKKAIREYVSGEIERAIPTMDNEMSDNSENAVQNKIIKAYVEKLVGDVSLERLYPKGIIIHEDGKGDISSRQIEGKTNFKLYFNEDELPGEWERIEGKGIIGSSGDFELGTTGGHVKIQLTENQLPAHTHSGKTGSSGNHGHSINGWAHSLEYQTTGYKYGHNSNSGGMLAGNGFIQSVAAAGAHTHSFTTDEAGRGEEFNIMNPYYVGNIWHRVV